MRLPRTGSAIVTLTGIATAIAILAGGVLPLLRGTAPPSTSEPDQSHKSYIIMEGVDINSNGPGHPEPALKLARPPESRQLLPPDLSGGERP
jgi:hypothetical protein